MVMLAPERLLRESNRLVLTVSGEAEILLIGHVLTMVTASNVAEVVMKISHAKKSIESRST